MLKKILVALAIIIVGFLIVVALQPSSYQVTRSASISGPPADVFTQVNDLHKFQDWSPWAKIDPAVKHTFAGPPAGTGAVCSWAGNKDVGKGSMTITESRPNDLIRFRLDFIEPFTSTATTEFTFKPEASQTVVTWTIFGQKNFLSKAFCLFMNMDKMLGGDFEKGLAQLKAIVEAAKK
jgi:uncharacterized protein YndB with AHSA1/START domain